MKSESLVLTTMNGKKNKKGKKGKKFFCFFCSLCFFCCEWLDAGFASNREGAFISAQDVTFADIATRDAGHYRVTLRLPVEGLFAGEEQQLELRLRDQSRVDPVLGATAVIRARIEATITMPAMPAMPRITEQAHAEAVPGDYGLHPSFAHGGDYLLTLRITPPVDEAFTLGFPLAVADEAAPRKARVKPFELTLNTAPAKVKAGETVTLHLQVWAHRETRDVYGFPTGKRTRELVTAFDLAHERKLHLMIVSRDFNFFAHLHPEPQSDGTFVLRDFFFPHDGGYRLFADTAPQGAGSQILSTALSVSGKTALPKLPETAIAGDIRYAIAPAQKLVAKKTQSFAFDLQRVSSGATVNDLQPYLGALGHLMMIHEDGQTFVHAHPDERDATNGEHGRLAFLARPPKPGNYHAWLEVQHAGQIKRAKFMVMVQ